MTPLLGGNWAKQNARFYYYDSETMSIPLPYPVIHHLFLAVNEAKLAIYDVDTNGGKGFFFKGET